MGNERSALSGLDIDEKAIEITDFWLLHTASLTSSSNLQRLSVFISEPSLHSTTNFGKPSPLERTAKNLMLHRHPCIIKYISSWRKGSTYYLATEEVKPLAQVISSQTTLQICIGLHSILRALIFLHDKALASHNNVSTSSIYVTPEGSWKLGGLEYLCRFSDFNQAYLKKIKNFRYEQAITPEETANVSDAQIYPIAIDQYAFGVLAEEVLRFKNTDDVPALLDFRELCRRTIQDPDPLMRTKLSTILEHPFFTHDFINIHAFLMELPLKTEPEKESFFSNLVNQLEAFPEKIVAEQLGKLLLSRMVLLDPTAQLKLLPFVLKPKTDDEDNENSGLFTLTTFKSCLVPKLLQMFCVHDTSIRLLLLSHLNSFIYAFQLDELKSQILPELLVGIKDHDDQLVSVTLRSLADLVPILGATTVIGGKRGKLFTDGRPHSYLTSRREVKINPLEPKNESESVTSLPLPERPSPDGGEDRQASPVIFVEEENTWSDWENHQIIVNDEIEPSSNVISEISQLEDPSELKDIQKVDMNLYKKKIAISDITELDIKHSKSIQGTKDEINFFMDMEPVIEKPKIVLIDNTDVAKSVFEVQVSDTRDVDNNKDDNDGWGEDLSDWGGDNEIKNE